MWTAAISFSAEIDCANCSIKPRLIGRTTTGELGGEATRRLAGMQEPPLESAGWLKVEHRRMAAAASQRRMANLVAT